jgi:polar amino acid transport system permease protein
MNLLDDLSAVLVGIPFTLALTLAAFVFGAVLGLPLCAMRMSRNGFTSLLAMALILTFRAIPPIVWLFIIFFGIGFGYLQLDPFSSAAIGLGLITAANMAEIYRGSLSAIHIGQWEASTVLNLSARHRARRPAIGHDLRHRPAEGHCGRIGDRCARDRLRGVSPVAANVPRTGHLCGRGPAIHRDQPAHRLAGALDRHEAARGGGAVSDTLDFWGQWFPDLLGGFVISLEVTAACLVLGIPLGLLLALGVQSKSAPLRWTALVIVEIGRGTPALILLQFAYFGLPTAGLTLTSFTAASLALAWCTGAYTSEIIRAGLQSVPAGQQEAAQVIGLNRLDALRYVILPQGLRVAVPALLGFSIIMLQASSLCFTIALPEIVSQAYIVGSNTFRYLPVFLLAALMFAAVCIPATILVSLLERRLGRHVA